MCRNKYINLSRRDVCAMWYKRIENNNKHIVQFLVYINVYTIKRTERHARKKEENLHILISSFPANKTVFPPCFFFVGTRALQYSLFAFQMNFWTIFIVMERRFSVLLPFLLHTQGNVYLYICIYYILLIKEKKTIPSKKQKQKKKNKKKVQ